MDKQKKIENQENSNESGANEVIKTYHSKELIVLMSMLHEMFEVVRVVDPNDTAVINFNSDGTITRKPYTCFNVWGKTCRCENCSSMCAKNTMCTLTKYELIKEDIFYIVSHPINVILSDGEKEVFVLEVVSQLTGEAKLCETQMSISDIIRETHEKIYGDALTGLYNRRFMDELLFLHQGQNTTAKSVGFILIDLYRFKQINDNFGHITGDEMLTSVAKKMKECIRARDSIVRIGGDEFVVILTDCTVDSLVKMAERLKAAIKTVTYGNNNEFTMDSDVGYSYVENFTDKNQIEKLLSDADLMMFSEKEAHREERYE